MLPSIGVPGTISKILWHFTGGPKWNVEAKCQESDPKPLYEAYAALHAILETRELHVGSFREIVRVDVPGRKYNPNTKKWLKTGYTTVERESVPV